MDINETNTFERNSAIEDFYHARTRGKLQDILNRLTGKPGDLLSYEEVRHKLRAQNVIERGLQDIPLDAIVGSVNRYQDFTRNFLPRQGIARDRWVRIKKAYAGTGLPPIEVYRIGQVYFVKDGNHRVSVARRLGWKIIEAYVEEVLTHVPLTPDIAPDELILKAEYAGFLAFTSLEKLRPEAILQLTAPGGYPKLEAQIVAHRPAVRTPADPEPPMEAISAAWYDTVYTPVAKYIAETGILKDFPDRTITDLYLWIVEHRLTLQAQVGREIRPEKAARHLVDRFSRRPRRIASRLGGKVKRLILPRRFETGPAPGRWRQEKQAEASDRRLFSDLLVTISGKPDGWAPVHLAIEVARRENARLQGLHVLAPGVAQDSPAVQAIEAEFERLCLAAGVSGKLTFDKGSVNERVWEHSRWNDLVVANLTFPPEPQPFIALGAGFHDLLQHCPRPLLAVPRRVTPLSRLLLAYDGSPKAQEALFVAAYLAGAWRLPLAVITVFEESYTPEETLGEAWQYLDTHAVEATYIRGTGPAVQEIVITADEQHCDLILIGGYGQHPPFGPTLGSTVDQVLRSARKPVLICR